MKLQIGYKRETQAIQTLPSTVLTRFRLGVKMKIQASVVNRNHDHTAVVLTDGNEKRIPIPARESGQGSSVSGGELLFLALATCFCNDIYREAAALGIDIAEIEVAVNGEFGGPGDSASNVSYRSRVTGDASEDELVALMRHTDTVAEIQNSLRRDIAVPLLSMEAVSTRQT